MSVVAPYRVHQSTSTVGTAAYALNPAILANNNFNTFYATGATVPYMVTDSISSYEIGYGVLTTGSPDSISRVSILLSSNSNSAVNWPDTTAKDIIAWEGANTSYPVIITNSTSIGITDWGKSFVYAGSSSITLNLPLLSTVPIGFSFEVYNVGTGILSVTTTSPDIYFNLGSSNIALSSGQKLIIRSIPGQGWLQFIEAVVGGPGAFSILTVNTRLQAPDGGTWSTTGINNSNIGSVTPATGAFTTLSASSTVSGTGFSTYLASPPAIGGTTPAAITGTTGQFNTSLTLGSGVGSPHMVVNGASSGSGAGAAVFFQNAGTTTGAVGHYSSVIGGAYNNDLVLYSTGSNIDTYISGVTTAKFNSAGLSVSSGLANSVTLAGSATNPQLSTSGGSILLNSATGTAYVGGATQATAPLVVSTVGTNVNYLQVQGGNSGASVYAQFFGSDSVVNGILNTKGGGYLLLQTGGATQVEIANTASATNYLTLTGSNGGNPTIGTSGGNMSLSSTGGVVLASQANAAIGWVDTSAGTNLTTFMAQNTSGVWQLSAWNDAISSQTVAYRVTRGTTYNVASHTWYTSTTAGTAVQGMQLNASNFQIGNGTYTSVAIQSPGANSWVNYLQLAGQVSGSSPSIYFTGSDTNVSGLITTRGTGTIAFQTGSATRTQFAILDNASGADYVTVTSGASAGAISTNAGNLTLNATGSNIILLTGLAAQNYSKQVPTTGFSITIGAGIESLILDPAGTLATGTITMPASPVDGQVIKISSTQTITTLTVNANSGQSIKNAPTTIVPSLTGTYGYEYRYSLSNTTWYRVQ